VLLNEKQYPTSGTFCSDSLFNGINSELSFPENNNSDVTNKV